jgi:uncharacterized ion transporter superfamily protein YfcC
MNAKKYLDRIRGWLPEKPSLSNSEEATNSTLKARTLGNVDSYWAKSKTFRLIVLITFFLILVASAFIVSYVFRPYPFLILAISIVIAIIAYRRRPRKQTRCPENSSQR